MKSTHPLYSSCNWFGFCVALLFAALVILPMIVIFVLYALMEFLITGNWSNANNHSKQIGQRIERPLWLVRSLCGLLPISPPPIKFHKQK